jgi:hypothetical protein
LIITVFAVAACESIPHTGLPSGVTHRLGDLSIGKLPFHLCRPLVVEGLQLEPLFIHLTISNF